MRLRCRQTSVRTTTSGCGFTSTFATNTAILQPPLPAWAPFSPSSHPKTSRWAGGARPPLLFGSSSRQRRSRWELRLRSQPRLPPAHAQFSTANPQASARPCEPGPVHCHPQRRGRPSRHRHRRPPNGQVPSRPGPHARTGQSPRFPQSDGGLRAVLGSASTAPGHRASWQQEYRDLEAGIRLRNYSTRTLEA
jgi:hypothetical protein